MTGQPDQHSGVYWLLQVVWHPCWQWTVPEISISKGPADDQSQPAWNATAVCEPASQPSLPAYVYHVTDILRSESLVRSPMKNQLTDWNFWR